MPVSSAAAAEKQVRGFIVKFEPKHQTLIRAVRKALRRRLPTAYELAYNNYNFFVLGYGPTSRPSDCILSMAAGAHGVGLCFVRGASLPDPSDSARRRLANTLHPAPVGRRVGAA